MLCTEEVKKHIEKLNQTIHNLKIVWSDAEIEAYKVESGMRRTLKDIRSLKHRVKIVEMEVELVESLMYRVSVLCEHELERNRLTLGFYLEDLTLLVSAGIVFSVMLVSLISTFLFILNLDIACWFFISALKWLSPPWS